MTARILEEQEYAAKLAGTELEHAWPYLMQQPGTSILVGEEHGEVVWCWAVVPYWHVEGAWIRPDHRRGTTAGRAWRTMARFLRASGIEAVLTAALTDDVRALIDHVGGRQLPGDHYVLPVPKE